VGVGVSGCVHGRALRPEMAPRKACCSSCCSCHASAKDASSPASAFGDLAGSAMRWAGERVAVPVGDGRVGDAAATVAICGEILAATGGSATRRREATSAPTAVPRGATTARSFRGAWMSGSHAENGAGSGSMVKTVGVSAELVSVNYPIHTQKNTKNTTSQTTH
jgi:hypothetical protein